MTAPQRGEIWLATLDPATGHEQAGVRPCLVVSADTFNRGPARLVYAVPVTSRRRGIFSHVEVTPPEGGLKVTSFIMTEQLRALSTQRLQERWGRVRGQTMGQVEACLRALLDL